MHNTVYFSWLPKETNKVKGLTEKQPLWTRLGFAAQRKTTWWCVKPVCILINKNCELWSRFLITWCCHRWPLILWILPQANAECSETAVYVNIEALRKNNHQSPPASAGSRHRSLESQEWEILTDQESGQEYYYNPVTRQSTWENPFAPHTDPEFLLEDLPLPSPTYSSPSADLVDSDWEKLFDESSGCHYFYNHVTKETSWDPPEELLSPSMEPLDTQAFRQDGPVSTSHLFTIFYLTACQLNGPSWRV